MASWFLNYSAAVPASWLEAMPDGVVLPRSRMNAWGENPGIVWVRLASGESPSALASDLQLAPGQQLVMLADEPNEALIVEAMAAGAAGCCNTHAAPEVLRQVALVVTNGGLWVGQSLLRQVVSGATRMLQQRAGQGTSSSDWQTKLSERECEVAGSIATGASNKEIAQQLGITERTVKAHLSAIFEKLGIRDRLQLSLIINGVSR